MKKITFAVSLENEKYLSFLMNKIKFVENSRVATGGMMSSPCLLIEFQGMEENYHEKGYIIIKSKSEWLDDRYFTIQNPDGISFKTFEDFLTDLNKIEIFDYYEIDNVEQTVL